MPNPTTNSGIRDNHKRGVVADFLKAKIHSGSRLSVVSAYFTIYAYDALREHLDQIDPLDFLFGDTDSLPAPDVLAQELADDLETALEQFTKIAAKLNGRR